eukprot:4158412-Pleurochrysis_carterae.AAC.7
MAYSVPVERTRRSLCERIHRSGLKRARGHLKTDSASACARIQNTRADRGMNARAARTHTAQLQNRCKFPYLQA